MTVYILTPLPGLSFDATLHVVKCIVFNTLFRVQEVFNKMAIFVYSLFVIDSLFNINHTLISGLMTQMWSLCD